MTGLVMRWWWRQVAMSAGWPGDVGLGVGRGENVRVGACPAVASVVLLAGDGEISVLTGHICP